MPSELSEPESASPMPVARSTPPNMPPAPVIRMTELGIPLILAAYLIAVALRLAQGSATVALTTAAALIAPGVINGGYGPIEVACFVMALAAGSVFAGHVNDSGFWLVGRLLDMDVKTTLKVWTVQQAIESVVAFALVLVLYGVVSLF